MPTTTFREVGHSDPATALGLVTAHLVRHPDDDGAWAVAAEALVRLERPDEAVEAAQQAQKPGSPQRVALLAWALAASGAFAKARRCLEGLSEPLSATAWDRVARAWERLGDPDAAIVAHGRAVAADRSDLGCALRFAERLEQRDMVERAASVVADVLAARPGWAPARRVRVRLLARAGDLEQAAAEARVLLEGNELVDEVATGLMLELARIEAGRGAVGPANAWAARGNRRALAEWVAEGGDIDALIDELDAVAQGDLPVVPREPQEARRSAFVVGFPRSGVSMVQQMLAVHPDVVAFDDVPLVDWALAAELPGSRWVEAARAVSDAGLAAGLRDAWWRGALRRAEDAASCLVVDALPLNVLRLDVIARAFPGAPVLLVVRDPRDAVLSAYFQDFRLNGATAQLTGLSRAARLFDQALTTWFRVDPKPGLIIRYEALLDEPERAMRPVLETLGLRWDPLVPHRQSRRLDRFETPTYAAQRDVRRRPSVGRWRIFEDVMAEALPVLQPWVERLGYAP